MRTDAFLHIRDEDLLRKLDALLTQERLTMAELLEVMAEVDARRLYAPAGYSSMFAFCVEKLHLSEDAAYKRIQAARAARRFPALLDAVADGRLHLTAAGLLAPHLTEENAGELIGAATHRRKLEIEEFLASRFGRSDVPTRIRVIAPIVAAHVQPATTANVSGAAIAAAQIPMTSGAPTPTAPKPELALAQVREERSAVDASMAGRSASGEAVITQAETAEVAGAQEGIPAADRTAAPTPVQRYLLQCPISKETHDLLRYAQALLSHALPDGEMDQVLQRALKALIPQLEKRKVAILSGDRRAGSSLGVGAGSPPVGSGRRPNASHNETSKIPVRLKPAPSHRNRGNRRIPAHVRRAVWERDERQCTFVSASGHRCSARRFLEYDHIEPVVRGGMATVNNIRLRCRAHNQLEAERVLGVDLIVRKREEARLAAAESARRRTSPTCAGAS